MKSKQTIIVFFIFIVTLVFSGCIYSLGDKYPGKTEVPSPSSTAMPEITPYQTENTQSNYATSAPSVTAAISDAKEPLKLVTPVKFYAEYSGNNNGTGIYWKTWRWEDKYRLETYLEWDGDHAIEFYNPFGEEKTYQYIQDSDGNVKMTNDNPDFEINYNKLFGYKDGELPDLPITISPFESVFEDKSWFFHEKDEQDRSIYLLNEALRAYCDGRMVVDESLNMTKSCTYMFKEPNYTFLYNMSFFEPDPGDIENYIFIIRTEPFGFD